MSFHASLFVLGLKWQNQFSSPFSMFSRKSMLLASSYSRGCAATSICAFWCLSMNKLETQWQQTYGIPKSVSVPAHHCVQSQGVLRFSHPLLTGHFDEHMNSPPVAFSATSAVSDQWCPCCHLWSVSHITHYWQPCSHMHQWREQTVCASKLVSFEKFSHRTLKKENVIYSHLWYVLVHMCCIHVSSCR
jgi:hypothetical protein